MPQGMGCLDMEEAFDSFDLPPYTRSLMDRYFSGNGHEPMYFLYAETAAVGDFISFMESSREAAKGLNGKVYTVRRLREMGFLIPESLPDYIGMKGGEEVKLLDFYILDLKDTTTQGRLCNSHCRKYIKSLKRRERENIDQIWERFRKTGDDYYRNLLMEHYRWTVKYIAERMKARLPDKVELDDLISAGFFGLADAIDAYCPSRDVKFETYCSPRIRGEMLDELRRMDWVPRVTRARARQLAKATQPLESCLGRRPTEEELAEELDMNMDEFDRLRRDTNVAGLVSLDTKYDGDDGGDDGGKDMHKIDAIIDERSTDPLAETQGADFRESLLRDFTRAEKLIITLYHFEDMTMEEIGDVLDLSGSRVSQMHSSIIERLEAKLHGQEEELLGRQSRIREKYIPLSRLISAIEGKLDYRYVADRLENDSDTQGLLEPGRCHSFRVNRRNIDVLGEKIRSYVNEQAGT